jgi:hypothetical protein
MYRVFACQDGAFSFVRATQSPLVALRYALDVEHVVCDPDGGCYDPDELWTLAVNQKHHVTNSRKRPTAFRPIHGGSTACNYASRLRTLKG